MTEQDIAHIDPAQLAHELNRCRQHGLDDLDLNLHKKPAVPDAEITHLADLARAYCAAIGVTAPTREAAIRRLLVDRLSAYAEQDPSDSEFVKRFFFDESGTVPKKGPTELQKDLTEELHVSDKRLAERRTAAFIRFATFLITFVAKVSHEVPAVTVRERVPAAEPQPTPPPQPHQGCAPLSWVGLGLAGLVVAASLFVTFLLLNHPGTEHTPTGATSATATANHFQSGKTHLEMAGEFGAPTFTDPRVAAGAGPKVQPYQQVQVACKVLAPSIPSASPDGYWYLIASPPWSGAYYAAANAFMNGDHVGQTTPLHNTDYAVPDCAS